MDLKNEILRRVEALPLSRQKDLLACFDALEQNRPRGEKGADLLPFVGALDEASAKEMSSAIEAGCEAVDLRDW